MAGGEGKRLKAVTGPLPKPMVKLMGKPLMERCLELLRENGITEVCASLRYNPGPIMAYFGDGERFGGDGAMFQKGDLIIYESFSAF